MRLITRHCSDDDGHGQLLPNNRCRWRNRGRRHWQRKPLLFRGPVEKQRSATSAKKPPPLQNLHECEEVLESRYEKEKKLIYFLLTFFFNLIRGKKKNNYKMEFLFLKNMMHIILYVYIYITRVLENSIKMRCGSHSPCLHILLIWLI